MLGKLSCLLASSQLSILGADVRAVHALIMAIPSWLNRESVQLFLVVLLTMAIHYYFISSKLQAQVDETIAEMEAEDAAKAAAAEAEASH